MRCRRALRMFDKELVKGNYKAAHSLLKQLQHMHGVLLGFGSAKLVTFFFFLQINIFVQNFPLQLLCWSNSYADLFIVIDVPKRTHVQELCMVDSSSFKSLVDSILCSIKYSIKFGLSDEEL